MAGILGKGMYKIGFARNDRAYPPNTLLLGHAIATMGAGPLLAADPWK